MARIKLTPKDWREIFPRAPQAVIDAFAAKQAVLDRAGITATRQRLAYFCANIEHECDGFTIPNLTENINYTAARMAEVWPNRFRDAGSVVAKYGSAPGWQRRAIDDIYGDRMGNRPGTSDGSTYIGRGGPQWTGRDGYAALQRLTSIPALDNPPLASTLDLQPEICAAFWQWKNLNRFADAGDFAGCVHAWNGGTNGMADRRTRMAGNEPIIQRLAIVADQSAAIPEPKPVVTPAKAVAVASVGTGASAVAVGVQQSWGWQQWTMLAIAVAGGGLIALGVWIARKHSKSAA
jgi:putative chitinase